MILKKSLLLLVGLFLAGCSGETSYPLVDGGSHSFANNQGKLTLINYWAIWCTPCREEIPELNHLAEKHADKLTILGVNYDSVQGEKLRSQLDKLGIEFPSLQNDPRAIWDLERATVLPETLVINSKGELIHRLIGPQTVESLEAFIDG